jgi:ELWxxDGT repeat protein
LPKKARCNSNKNEPGDKGMNPRLLLRWPRIAPSVWAVLTLFTETATAAQLVRDINLTSNASNNFIIETADLPNVSLFVFNDGLRGKELWATDGSPAGTQLVRDINPGSADGMLAGMTVMNGVAYFWADDGTNGPELWRSDGSTAGTYLVANIKPNGVPVDGLNAAPLLQLNDVLYFQNNDGQSGIELWRSDGTNSGTYRLADINPGAASSEPSGLVVLGSRIFFVAADATSGRELWTTDGTSGGTRRVRDANPGPADGAGPPMVAGNTLFFTGSDGTHGGEIWRATADGTSAAMVVDLNRAQEVGNPGRNLGSNPIGLFAVGNGIVFSATTVENNQSFNRLYRIENTGSTATTLRELSTFSYPTNQVALGNRSLFVLTNTSTYGEPWVTDGSVSGTGLLLPDAALHIDFFQAVIVGNELFSFGYAAGGATGINLWRTDGTAAGTQVYAQLAQPSNGGNLLTALGGKLYFYYGRSVDAAGGELWVADGSPGGTQRVADINPGAANSRILDMGVTRGRLIFFANDGTSGFEPWISDGTAVGTLRLGDFDSTVASDDARPSFLTVFGNRLLFTADDGVHGTEPWITDGTESGTLQLADIEPESIVRQLGWYVPMDGFALFVGEDVATGRELWRTDGTPAGTMRVTDIVPGPAHSEPIVSGFKHTAEVMNNVAYFVANTIANGKALWRSDGTAAGTYMVHDPTSDQTGGAWSILGQVNGLVLFAVREANQIWIWASDGTSGGTGLVSNDVEIMDMYRAAMFKGMLYFSGKDATGDEELWRTDGSPAGTERVIDIDPNGSSVPAFLSATDDFLFFNACLSAGTCGLYASDGTLAGTRRLSEAMLLGEVSSDGTQTFFRAEINSTMRLFVSDATPAGTRELIPSTVAYSGFVSDPVLFGGALLFTATHPSLGPVLWRTDADGMNTRVFLDLDPGTSSGSSPDQFVAIGSRLYFTAYTPDFGRELWMLETGQPSALRDQAQTAFNTQVRIDVLANDTALSGALDRNSLEILTSPSFGTASIDAGSREVIYVPNMGFAGLDTFTYRVRDNQGFASNPALVSIVVTAPAGQGPGTPPAPPPTTNPPPSSGGGGGGGALGFEFLLLASVLALRARRKPSTTLSSRTSLN